MRSGERSRDRAVLGATAEFEGVQNVELAHGSFLLHTTDLERDSAVAVLGNETALVELFPEQLAVGKRIRTGDARFTVIGVLRPRGQQFGIALNDIVLIAVRTRGRELGFAVFMAPVRVCFVLESCR